MQDALLLVFCKPTPHLRPLWGDWQKSRFQPLVLRVLYPLGSAAWQGLLQNMTQAAEGIRTQTLVGQLLPLLLTEKQ